MLGTYDDVCENVQQEKHHFADPVLPPNLIVTHQASNDAHACHGCDADAPCPTSCPRSRRNRTGPGRAHVRTHIGARVPPAHFVRRACMADTCEQCATTASHHVNKSVLEQVHTCGMPRQDTAQGAAVTRSLPQHAVQHGQMVSTSAKTPENLHTPTLCDAYGEGDAQRTAGQPETVPSALTASPLPSVRTPHARTPRRAAPQPARPIARAKQLCIAKHAQTMCILARRTVRTTQS